MTTSPKKEWNGPMTSIEEKEKQERLRRYSETGRYMNSVRTDYDFSLAKLGEELGFSANYLSEVERGIKPPSDALIELFCKFFNLDDTAIYTRLGRPSAAAQTELETHGLAQELLTKIGKNDRLTSERKNEIYSELLSWYKEVIDKEQ